MAKRATPDTYTNPPGPDGAHSKVYPAGKLNDSTRECTWRRHARNNERRLATEAVLKAAAEWRRWEFPTVALDSDYPSRSGEICADAHCEHLDCDLARAVDRLAAAEAEIAKPID